MPRRRPSIRQRASTINNPPQLSDTSVGTPECLEMRGSFASASTKLGHRFKPLKTLPTEFSSVFRNEFFVPQKPVVFPRGLFRSIPATSRWFVNNDHGSLPGARLSYEYLNQYSDCHVPLELTSQTTAPERNEVVTSQNEGTFQRSYAPLSLFLNWTRSVQESSENENRSSNRSTSLYLAQCQLLDLPATLCDDLPTPSIVTTAGKGDVYDTNIWIGLAPTYTPLHRDPNPNLFVQLAGSKHVRLLSPESGLRIFSRIREQLGKNGGKSHAAYRGEDMMKGPERELLDRAIWEEDPDTECQRNGEQSRVEECEEGYEAILNAGDGLFIPLGWWHSIKGVGKGITGSVSISRSLFRSWTLSLEPCSWVVLVADIFNLF